VREYRQIQKNSVLKFMFWCGVGLLGGVSASAMIKNLPFKDGLTLAKAKKYRMWSFISISLPCTYHGFALARRDYRIGRKELLDNPEFSSVDIS
jgi:GH24 family phage-related lysozyme (muramidase)